MALEPVPFGGLSALVADELVPLEAALDATNCYVDDGTIRGRNGYRSVATGAIGSGTAQGLWRFRPTASGGRSIAVQGGHIWMVADPTSETATVGGGTDLGAPFGASANISGVQLGQYFYLASDESPAIWRRVKSDFTLESLTAIPQPAAPSVSNGTLSLILFDSLGAPALAGGLSITSYTNHLANLYGSVGGTAIFDFGTAKDWSSTNWLLVICSPETTSGGGGAFKIELATSGGSWESIASSISDTFGAAGSPACVFCSLRGLTSTTRAAVQRIRFTQLGPTSDSFTISGVMPIPSAPSPGPVDYYITYYNSGSGMESVLSPLTMVQYNSDGITFPQADMGQWYYNSFQYLGVMSTDPVALGTFSWNASGGGASPSPSEFAAVKTFFHACPAGSYDTVRLWRQTPTGIRLVKEQSGVSPGSTTYSITDDVGDAALSHQVYKAGGPPPPCTVMAAVNQRIVCGGDPATPNRLYISSYVAPHGAPSLFGAPGDPWPQFPSIPLIASDGWAFDISPTSAEQILWCGNGDRAAYIGTNEAMYVMTSLDPNSPPFKVFERGVIGRRAACWAESALFWAAHDGIYMAKNRSEVEELTKDIRRLYRATFQPDASVVVLYQDRKLYAIRGNVALRYDFVTESWTKHTLAHTMSHGEDWRDPAGIYQQMWFQSSAGFLYRWQPGISPGDSNRATTDADVGINAWTYSSGFSVYSEAKTRIRSVFLDTTDVATVSLYKDATPSPVRSKAFPASGGEHQLPFASDLTAYKWRLALTGTNAVQVRRCLWERAAVAGEGG